MRNWNTNPSKMCKNHLLGEHNECHMFIGSIKKGISLDGYIDKGLVEVHNIAKRHDELVKEMEKRDMNHNSPIEDWVRKELLWTEGNIDVEANKKELKKRCNKCKFN